MENIPEKIENYQNKYIEHKKPAYPRSKQLQLGYTNISKLEEANRMKKIIPYPERRGKISMIVL
jgi:hypothetical protein